MNPDQMPRVAVNASTILLLALMSLLVYLVLFGLNLASANRQLVHLGRLPAVRESAANLRSARPRFGLAGIRLGTRRGMSADQIKDIKRSLGESGPRLFGDLREMEAF